MEQFIYCLLCLGTGVKVFHFSPAMLRIYKDLTSIHDELSTKHLHACYECAYLLHKYEQFRNKCCNAYNILCSLSSKPFEVNSQNIKRIDRKQNKLESMLTACPTLNYHHLDQQHDGCYDLEKQFHDNSKFPSKIESVSLVSDTNENDLNRRLNMNGEKVETDAKTTQEHDNCSLHILKTISSDDNSNETDFCVESTNKDSELEIAQNPNNEYDVASHIKLEQECFDSDSDCVISSKCNKHNKEESKFNLSNTKKRKFENICKKSVHCKEKKKRRSRSKALPELIKSSNSVDYKSLKRKESRKKGKASLKKLNKINKDDRFSINSNIFEEHMTIIQLTPEDAKSELLLRKESSNYKSNLHKCDLCYRGFISEATYETHMKKHSLEYGSLKCDICQLTFMDTRYLTNHRIVCHTRKFLCKTCPYVCFGANQARAHIRSHKGKKYTCKECEEIFRFPNSLSTHMRLRHSVELVCDFCGSTFASPKGLDCHKRLLHRKEKNEKLGPKCEECDVHFASDLAWKRHRVLCSRHDVSDGCGVCGETFPDAGSLRTHLRTHGPLPTTWNCRLRKKPPPVAAGCVAPQPCSHCEKELRNKKEYKMHMASEHPDVDPRTTPEWFTRTPQMKWVCEVCGNMFKHYSLFISHQRKHTGEKPYSCPDCGKRFKRADAVKAHRPLHTNEYMFKCHVCDKAYGDRGKLNRHIKSHLNIKPYKCPYCDKSFIYQCVVNAHAKYVHCKEPYPKRDRSKRTVKPKIK